MSARVQQSRSSHATRSVQVTQREPPGEGVMARIMGAPPLVDVLVAHVGSSTLDDHETSESGAPFPPPPPARWTAPAVTFERLDAKPNKFTRGQWEALKHAVDRAFDTFERTWPLEDPCADGHDFQWSEAAGANVCTRCNGMGNRIPGGAP